MFLRLVTFIITFGLLFQLRAQSDSLSKWNLAVSPTFGLIIPHTKQITHLITGHSFGGYAQITKRASGKKYWHQIYDLPTYGFDINYVNTGNVKQLGQQVAASFILHLPLNTQWKNNQLKTHGFYHALGLGLGLGYSTKIWNLESNHQAAVLGSHLNIALTLHYRIRMAQLPFGSLYSGIRITHLSNGAFQVPNLGTNNGTIFLEVLLSRKNNASTPYPNLEKPSTRKWTKSIGAMAGLKEITPAKHSKYSVFSLSLLGECRRNFKSSFGLGLDAFYNSSLKQLMLTEKNQVASSADIFQIGAVFSYTLHLNNFELKMQEGFYIRDKFKLNGSLYNRFGLRYFFSKNCFSQLTLKTHFAKADFGEIGIGYAF